MTEQEMKSTLIKERKIIGNYVYYPIEVIEFLTGKVDREIPDIDVFLSKIGFSKRVFYSDVRRNNVTDVRYAVCKTLREKGLTFVKIGNLIHKNNASVIYLVDKYQPYNPVKVREYLEILNNL